MKCVIDTSAWIEWVLDSPTASLLAPHLPDPASSVVPTLVQLELAKWFVRERGDDAAARMIAHTLRCDVVPLDTPIALRAAELSRSHRLATADAIVYATTLQHGAVLLTCDSHFQDLPHTRYVAKVRIS